MTLGSAVIVVVLWAIFAWTGWTIGKSKGYAGGGLALGLLLGLIGIIIIACIPQSKEAKAAAAQRQYEIQAEAARRTGYPFPPQPPQEPWQQPQSPQEPWQQPPGWQPPNP